MWWTHPSALSIFLPPTSANGCGHFLSIGNILWTILESTHCRKHCSSFMPICSYWKLSFGQSDNPEELNQEDNFEYIFIPYLLLQWKLFLCTNNSFTKRLYQHPAPQKPTWQLLKGFVHYCCWFIHAGENRNQEEASAEECDWWDQVQELQRWECKTIWPQINSEWTSWKRHWNWAWWSQTSFLADKHSSSDYGLQGCKEQSGIKLSLHALAAERRYLTRWNTHCAPSLIPFSHVNCVRLNPTVYFPLPTNLLGLDPGQGLAGFCQPSCCPRAGQRSVCKEDAIPTLGQTAGRLLLVLQD